MALKRIKAITLGGMNRLKTMVALNYGYRYKGEDMTLFRILYRKPILHFYDSYLENCQYDHLEEWSPNLSSQQMDDRKTQPKKVFPLPKIASDLFSSHIVTEESRLNISIEDDDEQENLDDFLEEIMLWPTVGSRLPSYFVNGSMFIRFFITKSKKVVLEGYNTKWCYPVFDDDGELKSLTIRFIYETSEYDKNGQMIWRWSQYKLNKNKDITYDNPVFDKTKNSIPKFKVKHVDQHNMGFVQGVWIKTSVDAESDDGESLLGGRGVLDYLDDFNYMAGKESSSIFYHLFPILAMYGVYPSDIKQFLKNMSYLGEDTVKGINILSTEKPPSSAAMQFLEAAQHGMGYASALQDKNLQLLQHALSIVLLDPERVAAHAQSGSAMKALFAPVVQYIKKKRPFLKKGICSLLYKIEEACKSMNVKEAPKPGTIIDGDKKWGSIFTDTVTDIQVRATYTSQLKLDKIISKKTATKHIAPDFGIKNVEEELKQIEKETQEETESELLRFQNENQIQNENDPNANKPNPKKPDKDKRTK